MAMHHARGVIENEDGLLFRLLAALVLAEGGAPPAPGIARQLHSGNLMHELNAVPGFCGRRASGKDKTSGDKRYGCVPK
jgi:hypothetical protein